MPIFSNVRAIASVSLLVACAITISSANAQNLSGKEGDVKRKVMYMPDATGDCPKFLRAYVAASGHSAFAATHIDYFSGGEHVCAYSINVRSQKVAEEAAMKSCTEALNRWRNFGNQPLTGSCMIYMSK